MTHQVSGLPVVDQDVAPGVFEGLVLELGGGEPVGLGRAFSVRGELSGSSGGSGCSEDVRVSGVSGEGSGVSLRAGPLPV